jgi:hypothetical protein
MGGGVLLPDGSVSDNHHLRLRSLYQQNVKEWDRIEADVSAEWLSHELEQKSCNTQIRVWLFVEDATGRRHWVKAPFNPAPYIANRQAMKQASLRATLEELKKSITEDGDSVNPQIDGSLPRADSRPEKTAQ